MRVTVEFIPGEKDSEEIVGAICTEYGYQEMIGEFPEEPQPNPETREEFAARMIREFAINVLRTHKVKPALMSARKAVDAEISGVVIS